MLKRLIGKIRKQPKPVRDNIALGIAGTFTTLVLSIWLYNMPARLAEFSQVAKSAESEPSGAFSDAWGRVNEQLATVKESIPDEKPKDAEVDVLYVAPQLATTSSDTSATIMSSSSNMSGYQPASSTAPVASIENYNTDVSSQPRQVRISTTTAASSSDTAAAEQ